MKMSIYNKLRKFESYFYTAYYANYTRAMTTVEMGELIDIAAELGIRYKYTSCPKCNHEFIKKVAALWYEQKNKLEEKKKDKDNVQ